MVKIMTASFCTRSRYCVSVPSGGIPFSPPLPYIFHFQGGTYFFSDDLHQLTQMDPVCILLYFAPFPLFISTHHLKFYNYPPVTIPPLPHLSLTSPSLYYFSPAPSRPTIPPVKRNQGSWVLRSGRSGVCILISRTFSLF